MKTLWVGTRKGIFRIRQASAGDWRIEDPMLLGSPVTFIHHDPHSQLLFAALNLGHFGPKLQATENGTDWHERSVPVYPPKPDSESEMESARGRVTNWSLVQIWSMASSLPSAPPKLWAGTIPGGLFQSTDAGESWSMVEDLWFRPDRAKWMGGGYDDAGIHSVLVDPRSNDHVLVGISSGGVWRTEDGGATWKTSSEGMFNTYMPPEEAGDPNSQDPHLVVRCRSNPDHLWIQHHNGVFRSTDNARHWTEIPNAIPSVFGFAVAVHPEDGDTAWFVPAIKDEFRVPVDGKLVVSRTRDGGKSFEVLSRGLPDQHAYHLVYRHGLDIAPDGTTLAIGSTTGGLWVTEDQGDHWQCVSNDLPPIYCVRLLDD